MDYWLIANSYSPRWGMHGLFRIRRGTNVAWVHFGMRWWFSMEDAKAEAASNAFPLLTCSRTRGFCVAGHVRSVALSPSLQRAHLT